MRAWKDVATLVKTRNLKGRFVARPAAGLPFLLEEGMQVAFVPPQTDLPREGVVDFASPLDAGSFEVGFDTVADGQTAAGLVGCHCLVRRAGLPELPVEETAFSWVGWRVLDEDGALVGEVTGLAENPAHPLLEVTRADGEGTASIPVIDEFIVALDEDAREITVDLPAGLLDL